MSDRLALVIGIESSPDSGLPTAPFSETDAASLAQRLTALGYGPDQVMLLVGPQATRTAISSRLRKLRTLCQDQESLLVFVAAPAFTIEAKSYFACHDTQADDLTETGLALETLLASLRACSCGRLLVFLDLRGEPLVGQSLDRFVGEQPGRVCFLSTCGEERSQISGSLKSGIWAHHLLEVLSGKVPRLLTDSHLLTVGALQGHLQLEMPRTLRATFREAPSQTPLLICAEPDERLVLADLSAVLAMQDATDDPRLQPLRRGALRSESTSKVKSLTGYRKYHHLPDRVNASSRKFVSDLAHDDVKQDVDEIYAAVRESMGYKRRDVEGSADRGSGFVRTPDFEYSISIDLVDDDPQTVVWRREVAGIRNPQVVLGRPFQQVFGSIFDTLVFEFVKPFDLEAWVDRIEDEMPEGIKLRTASDCSSCDVHVRGKGCLVRLFRDRVEIHQGQKSPGSTGMVEAFLHFQEMFAGRRDLQALPLIDA